MSRKLPHPNDAFYNLDDWFNVIPTEKFNDIKGQLKADVKMYVAMPENEIRIFDPDTEHGVYTVTTDENITVHFYCNAGGARPIAEGVFTFSDEAEYHRDFGPLTIAFMNGSRKAPENKEITMENRRYRIADQVNGPFSEEMTLADAEKALAEEIETGQKLNDEGAKETGTEPESAAKFFYIVDAETGEEI